MYVLQPPVSVDVFEKHCVACIEAAVVKSDTYGLKIDKAAVKLMRGLTPVTNPQLEPSMSTSLWMATPEEKPDARERRTVSSDVHISSGTKRHTTFLLQTRTSLISVKALEPGPMLFLKRACRW